jgi:hypothetical protein
MAASTSPIVKERRRFRRQQRQLEPALFRYSNDRDRPAMARGQVENISGGGVAIRGTQLPQPDAEGELTIEFEGFQLVSAARVMRVWEDGFALEFLESDEV